MTAFDYVSQRAYTHPVELAVGFPQQRILVVGAGDLYTGFMSVEDAMNFHTGGTANRLIADPKFFTDDGKLKPEHKNLAGRKLKDFEKIPAGTVAFILSPNDVHLEHLRELTQKSQLRGIYVEKPAVKNLAELEELRKIVKASKVPIYFGDHYLSLSLALQVVQGRALQHQGHVKILSDPTGQISRAIAEGRPLLGEIKRVDAKILELSEGLENRAGIFRREAGGGVLLDLQIHLSNIARALGLDISKVTLTKLEVHDQTRPGSYRPLDSTLPGAAEERARFSGKLPDGGDFSFETAQFAGERKNYFEIEDTSGLKLRLNLDTRSVMYMNAKGDVLGEIMCAVDPYVLTVQRALNFFASAGPTDTAWLEVNEASIRAIEALKAKPPN